MTTTTLNFDNVDLTQFQQVDNPMTAEDVLNQQKKTRLQNSISQAFTKTPEQQVEVNQLANQFKLPAPIIETNLQGMKNKARLQSIDLEDLVKTAPQTASYLTNINNATIAQNDITTLRDLEVTLKGQRQEDTGYFETLARGIGSRTTSLLGSLSNFIAQTGDYLEEQVPIGGFVLSNGIPMYLPPDQFRAINGGRAFGEAGEALKETDFNYQPATSWEEVKNSFSDQGLLSGLGETVAFGVEQTAVSIPDMIATVYAFAPYVLSRSEEIGQERAENKGISEATIRETVEAMPFALGSALLEKILPDTIFKGMSKTEIEKVGQEIIEGTTSKVQEILKRTVEGGVIEGSTEFVQEGFIEYIGERYGTDANFVIEEMIDRGLAGAVGGSVGGSIISGGVESVRVNMDLINETYNKYLMRKMNSVEREQARLAIQSANEQRDIDGVNEYASKSQLRELDPDAFRQFVENANTQDLNLYIDSTQLRLYLAELGQSDDPAVKLLREKLNEALATGADTEISLPDFATTLAGTEHFDALREAMTMSAETTAPFRQEQEREATDNYIRSLMNEAESEVSQYVEAQDIYAQVQAQLIDTGQVSPQSASIMAKVVPAWATVFAKRNGISIKEAYEKSGLIIEGPMTGEAERIQGENALLQVLYRGVSRGAKEIDPNITWFSADESLANLYGDGKSFNRDLETGNVFRLNDDVESLSPLEFANRALQQASQLNLINKETARLIREDFLNTYNNENARAPVTRFWSNDENKEITANFLEDLGFNSIRLKEKGIETFGFVRLASQQPETSQQNIDEFTPVDAGSFYESASKALGDNPNGQSATLFTEEQYAGMNLYTMDDGNIGFGIEGDMLVSVYKDPSSNVKGAMAKIMPAAIKAGARRLEAFDGFLTEQYSKYGFKEIERIPWDDQYAPANWDYEKLGRPDVVVMKYEGNTDEISTNAPENAFRQQGRIRRSNELLAESNERESDGSLAGLPRQVGQFTASAWQPAQEVARRYAESAGLEYNPPATYAQVDVERAIRIAELFEQAEHRPQDPEVKEAYQAMIDETIAQYEAILESGLVVEFINYEEQGDPYDASPRQMTEDVRNNNHMWVFSTRDGFGSSELDVSDNPLLAETKFTDANGNPMLANDVFRVVHDYFGHVKEGVGFRAAGEENAWRAHSAMYSPLARRAMTTETRGQNSWVNFGPNSEFNRTASGGDTIYADQKVTLLPEWVSEEGAGDAVVPRKIQEGDASTIRTGEPVTFNYSHNTESATTMFGIPEDESASFGRYFEPAGKYVSIVGDNYVSKSENIETGVLTLNNPLVVDNDDLNWKKTLSEKYNGLRGKELSVALINDGYDGVITTEADRYISEIVDFTSFNLSKALYQNEGVTRGYYDPDQSLIRLTEASNLSTFLHEFAHFMYDMEIKASKNSPDSMNMLGSIHNWFKRNAEDVAKEASDYAPNTTIIVDDVTSYLDTGTSGDVERDKAIQRAVHEQFARGFETYLMEGKAPSIELRNVFRTFARWLTQIYRSIRGDLRVNLDDEMRQVFDRLLATEEQLETARARARYEPMFTDAAMAGMTETQWQEYQQTQQKNKDKQTETLRETLIKQLKRTTEKWWKEELADEIDVQTEALSKERVYRTRETLKNGDVKLDHAVVKDMVGEDVTNKRGIQSRRIPSKLNGMTAKGGKGLHPDEAAVIFGYGSGDEMIQDLIDAVSIKDKAEAQAQAAMIDRHGDVMNDGTIEKEADDALLTEERGLLILKELRNIAKKTKATPRINRQALKSIAEEQIAKLSFRNIHPAKYRKAEIRHAAEAATLYERGDYEGAMRAKTQQALNYYLNKTATEARNETTKIVERMARYRKKSVREAIARGGEDYLGQIDKILARFEFRKSASLKQLSEKNRAIEAWMMDKINNEGDALVLTPEVLDELYQEHWKNVPFSDLKGINDSVKNIEHVARYSDKIRLGQEEIDFKKLVNKWVGHIDENGETRFTAQRTDSAEGRNWGRFFMAQMTKIPFMARWLDGGEVAGLSHDILVQPFTDAYAEEVTLWKKVGEPVMKMIEGRSKEDIARHNRKYYIPELRDEINDGNIYGNQIIAIALNTGNAGNLKKMLLGEDWASPDNEADISLDNPKLKAVLAKMTKSDWELVQSIWDKMDELYPMMSEVHRRTTGLTPPKVEATPIQTPFGEYRGGYYPVKYDPNRSAKASDYEAKSDAEVDSMFNGGMSIHASVTASATNERTGYYAPIRLNLDVVPSHFQETIHYITHHDAVRQVNKMINHPEVREQITSKLGPEEYKQLKPWLNDIAKDGRESTTKLWWEDIVGRLRFGVTLGTMGFKASTGLMQLLGISNIVAEVGFKHTMKAVRQIWGSPKDIKEAWQFASANSKILNDRLRSMDREIKNAMNRISGEINIKSGNRAKDIFHKFDNSNVVKTVQEVSMKHIAYIQAFMVDLPTWYAAYIKEREISGDEAKAFRAADVTVENIQGSGVTKDLPTILRSRNEMHRMLTMFMTFFSSLWNIQRDMVKGTKSGLYSPTTLAAKLAFFMVVPVAVEMLIRGEFDREDEEPEETLQNFMTKVALYPMASVPFARDIASGVIGDYGYNLSPIASLIEQGTQSIPELLKRPLTDEEITKGQVKGATKFTGALLGIPATGQIWATSEHLYEVMEEGEELTVRELLLGPDREDK